MIAAARLDAELERDLAEAFARTQMRLAQAMIMAWRTLSRVEQVAYLQAVDRDWAAAATHRHDGPTW